MKSRLDHLRRLFLDGVSHRSLVWAELNRAAGEAPQATPARPGPAAQLRNYDAPRALPDVAVMPILRAFPLTD